MKVYIGADHGGFRLKEKIIRWLEAQRIPYEDMGNHTYQPRDDYPDFSVAVSRMVAGKRSARGIIICRSGVGACIAANKIKGIRAGQALNTTMARKSREDDDANVLCLGADYVTFKQAAKIITVWLNARASTAKRHQRRLKKIKLLEQKQ